MVSKKIRPMPTQTWIWFFNFSFVHDLILKGNLPISQKIFELKKLIVKFWIRHSTVYQNLRKNRFYPSLLHLKVCFLTLIFVFLTVPLLSYALPTDTWKLYKSGLLIRLDTTLDGFQNFKWSRRDVTNLFSVISGKPYYLRIDHADKDYGLYLHDVKIHIPFSYSYFFLLPL